MKQWFVKQWKRFKGWVVALLVAVGLIATLPVLAVPTEYTYQRATEYEDGTPLPLEEIAETRLYCSVNGIGPETLQASETGADGSISADLVPGIWECVATHVATNSRESAYSEPVTRTVLTDAAPKAPVLNP